MVKESLRLVKTGVRTPSRSLLDCPLNSRCIFQKDENFVGREESQGKVFFHSAVRTNIENSLDEEGPFVS